MDIMKIRNNIKHNNIYVNDNSFYNNIKNMSNDQLSNLSWSVISEDFEEDILKKSNYDIDLSNSHSSLSNIVQETKENILVDNKNKLTDLNDIIKITFEDKKDLLILEYQTYVSGYLRKNIKMFIDYKINKKK